MVKHADIPITQRQMQLALIFLALQHDIMELEVTNMSVIIKAHYDGRTIVPDGPVDLPINKPLEFELVQSSEELVWDPEKAKEAVRRIASRAVRGLNISDESLRRENMYEPPRGL